MKNPDSSQPTPDEPWDDLFRQRLAGYTDQPPTDALEHILGGGKPARPRLYEPWALVRVALLLLLGAGGWLFVRQYNSVSPVAGRMQQSPKGARSNTPAVAGSRSWQQPILATGANLPPPGQPDEREELAVASPKLAETTRLPTLADRVTSPKEEKTPLAVRPWPSSTNTASAPRLTDRSTKRKRTAADLRTPHPLNQTTRRASRYLLHTTGLSSAKLASIAGAPAGQPGHWPTISVYRSAGIVTIEAPAVQALPWLPPLDLLTGRPARSIMPTAVLPVVAVNDPVTAPVASRPQSRPSLFASLTPLYTYQQINPNQTDADFVSDIRVTHPLAVDRLGGRLQTGVDWRLAARLRLRTSVVYQQVRQVLHYAVRSAQPDSVRAVVVDEQSVQVTPFFARRNVAETDVWHYAGLSMDLVWQLNRHTNERWQHYLTAGATMGRYMSRGGAINGFVQLAYGIERPLSAGLHLRLEPTLQLGWQNLTDQANRFQNRPYSYGLALGLRFR